jgi:hypothetical protein
MLMMKAMTNLTFNEITTYFDYLKSQKSKLNLTIDANRDLRIYLILSNDKVFYDNIISEINNLTSKIEKEESEISDLILFMTNSIIEIDLEFLKTKTEHFATLLDSGILYMEYIQEQVEKINI